MDDVTILLQTAACTARLQKRLEELLTWAQGGSIKSAKSRSLSIRKGARSDNISLSVDSEKILSLVDQPVRSLERLSTADLSEQHVASSVSSQLLDGLKMIDQSPLPGEFKV